MELNHLKYFYYVAREGGYSKASKVLRIAQPAISKMVKNLEESLDVELFERIGRNVRLTKVGNDVYRKCEIIFGHLEDIKECNRKKQHRVQGSLNFTAAEPIASHIVPLTLPHLLRDHDSVYPQVIATTATDAVQILSQQRCEFALLFHAPDLPDQMEVRQQFPVTFRLVVATSKAKTEEVCSAFIGSREVDNVSNKSYPTLTKLRKRYPAAEIKISSNSFTGQHKLALAGLGVAVLPEFMVKDDVKAKRLSYLLADEDLRFQMKLVTLKTHVLSPVAEVFIKHLATTMSKL